MTVDREQIRRDAESFVGDPSWAMSETERRLARHCLALLAELEQAELAKAATRYLHHVSHEQCTGPDGQCEAKCEHADVLRAALEEQPGETA